jgi:hypothetical protein
MSMELDGWGWCLGITLGRSVDLRGGKCLLNPEQLA